ncbi:MAG: TRAP transporter large permease subunit [Bilophila wadsworthia]
MVPVFDRRKLRPLILALAIALCAFQLTTCTGMWLLDPLIVRATHVGLVLSMLFLWRSSNRSLRKNPRPEPAWSFLFDILMIAMSAGAAAYIITNFSYIQDRMPHIDELTAWDLFWGAGLIIAILEATRRVAGLALVIVSGIALLYAFFGHLLPGSMGHLYLAPNQIIESLYLLNDGIWGSSIGASATIIYVFILFGALLEKTNMASVFLELACLVTRNAKAARQGGHLRRALFGSVSGSAVTSTHRAFTIPAHEGVATGPNSGASGAVARRPDRPRSGRIARHGRIHRHQLPGAKGHPAAVLCTYPVHQSTLRRRHARRHAVRSHPRTALHQAQALLPRAAGPAHRPHDRRKEHHLLGPARLRRRGCPVFPEP